MPRVSVIVPAYNAARYLGAAIASVARQTYSKWELIVIDDGSTDNTRVVAQSYVPVVGEKLRYIYQSNRGLPAARNAGMGQARGEFIAILDADDVWLPAHLAREVTMMDQYPAAGLVHSRVARINVDGEIIEYPPFPLKYLSGKIATHLFTRRANIACPSVLFRKECLHAVGYFDETMRATEDRDLWFRIAQRYEVAFIDEILAYSRMTPGSMSKNADRMLQWQLFFLYKHYKRGACSWVALREALGEIYREKGDVLFSGGQLRNSICVYLRAVMYNPFKIKNIYMLARACAESFLKNALYASAPNGDRFQAK